MGGGDLPHLAAELVLAGVRPLAAGGQHRGRSACDAVGVLPVSAVGERPPAGRAAAQLPPGRFLPPPRRAAAACLLRQPAVQPCVGPVPRRVEPHAGHRPGRAPDTDPAAVSAELSCHPAQRRDLDADGLCVVLPCVPAAGPALCQTPAAHAGGALRRAAGLYAVGAAAVRQRRLFLAVQSVPCILRRAGRGAGGSASVCTAGPRRLDAAAFTPRGLYGARRVGAGLAQCAAAHTGVCGGVPAVPAGQPHAVGAGRSSDARLLRTGPDPAPPGAPGAELARGTELQLLPLASDAGGFPEIRPAPARMER